jgi:hypothetical protein
MTGDGLPKPSRATAPPMGFLPLQRLRKREPTRPGFASSRFRCGSRVFHPPAALRLPQPSGPLGPVTLLGFPLRGFSLPAEPRRLSAPAAFLPLSAQLVWSENHTCLGADPTPRHLSPRESVVIERGLAASTTRCLPEVQRSRAFRTRVASRGRSPHRLCSRFGCPKRQPASQGVDPRVRCCRSPKGAATLLRFSHLVSLPRTSNRDVLTSRRQALSRCRAL